MAIAKERLAACRMFVTLAQLARKIIQIDGSEVIADSDIGTMLLIMAAVIIGHAEQRPMNKSSVAAFLDLPRTTIGPKLDKLVEVGALVCEQDRYFFMEPERAIRPPEGDVRRWTSAVAKTYEQLVPLLTDLDTKGFGSKRHTS
ncbi:hypothetical protein [Bradyrhizobium sp. Ec3.3]|uniref:hypothetical protein n=2 Tax=unclassified Bradyrhizobium TaxID=2631580 RepID=UPI0012ECB6A0|nr:hypothetical protein [Bradyrhizobium sp. Ec3.3]